jgi:hypothetical protein
MSCVIIISSNRRLPFERRKAMNPAVHDYLEKRKSDLVGSHAYEREAVLFSYGDKMKSQNQGEIQNEHRQNLSASVNFRGVSSTLCSAG